jgi:hypothetical protein
MKKRAAQKAAFFFFGLGCLLAARRGLFFCTKEKDSLGFSTFLKNTSHRISDL